MQYIERKGVRGSIEINIVKTEIPNDRAEIAYGVMKQLAIATACPDGEDSSGRQKLRLLTPDEVVDRAAQIADAAWKEFRARGWLLDVPVPTPPRDYDYPDMPASAPKQTTPKPAAKKKPEIIYNAPKKKK